MHHNPKTREGCGCPKFLAGKVFRQVSVLLEHFSSIFRQHQKLSFPARRVAAGKSAPISGTLLDFGFSNLVTQHCDPPYRAIGHSYTYCIYIFLVSQSIALYPPSLGVSQNNVEGGGGLGGVSQVNAALSAIGRFRGVKQLYCRKSRLSGSLSFLV